MEYRTWNGMWTKHRYAILWSIFYPPLQKLAIFCFIHQSKVLIGWSDKMRRNMKINFIFCYGLPRARTWSLEILSGWLKTNVEKYQTRSTGPRSQAPVHSYHPPASVTGTPPAPDNGPVATIFQPARVWPITHFLLLDLQLSKEVLCSTIITQAMGTLDPATRSPEVVVTHPFLQEIYVTQQHRCRSINIQTNPSRDGNWSPKKGASLPCLKQPKSNF